jgi:hypothetical protein
LPSTVVSDTRTVPSARSPTSTKPFEKLTHFDLHVDPSTRLPTSDPSTVGREKNPEPLHYPIVAKQAMVKRDWLRIVPESTIPAKVKEF